MSSPIRRPLLAALLGAAAAAGVASVAARAEPAPPFAQLLRDAGAQSPRLAEAEAALRAAQGRADQAGVRPNPTLEVQTENLAGGRAADLIAPSQSTLSVSQTLELGGKRASRVEAGRAEIAAATARRAQAAAEFGYQLAVAYAEAEAADARLALLGQDVERAGEDLRAARALVEAGKEADLRRVQGQAALSAAQAELEAGRADRDAALGRLTALAGSPTPFTAVSPSLLERAAGLPAPAGPAPQTTPAIAAAEAERDAAARRVNVERTKAAPDLTVSLGARRIEGLGSTLLVGGASLPLPLFDRNRGNISAARAEQDAADARLRVARLDAEADWRSGQARAAAATATLRAAMEGASAADEAYRLARIGFEAGKTPLVELLAARRALIEAELRALTARTQRIQAEAALARLAGRTPFGG
jgi:cobalt-zinc-cadmium efflux system outer membrane protein